MTPRENLLHLLRKEGYEEVPVDFSCVPLRKRVIGRMNTALLITGTIFRCPGNAFRCFNRMKISGNSIRSTIRRSDLL